jgi:hypothetical protein
MSSTNFLWLLWCFLISSSIHLLVVNSLHTKILEAVCPILEIYLMPWILVNSRHVGSSKNILFAAVKVSLIPLKAYVLIIIWYRSSLLISLLLWKCSSALRFVSLVILAKQRNIFLSRYRNFLSKI